MHPDWIKKSLLNIRDYYNGYRKNGFAGVHPGSVGPLSLFYKISAERLGYPEDLATARQLRDIAARSMIHIRSAHILDTPILAWHANELWKDSGEASPVFELLRGQMLLRWRRMAEGFLDTSKDTEYFEGSAGLHFLGYLFGDSEIQKKCLAHMESFLWESPWGWSYESAPFFFKVAFERQNVSDEVRNEKRMVLGYAHGISGTISALCTGVEETFPRRRALSRKLAETLLKVDRANGGPHLPLSWPMVEFQGDIRESCAWCNGDPGIGWALARHAAVFESDPTLEKTAIGKAAKRILLRSIDPEKNPVTMDARFCHGHSSLAQMSLRLFLQSGSPEFLGMYEAWITKLNTPYDPERRWSKWMTPAADDMTFGRVGIAFTLFDALWSDLHPWDTLYFMDPA